MAQHFQDSDCTVDPNTNCCTECGTAHGAPCYHCRARAFHRPGCVFLLGQNRPYVNKLQRMDEDAPIARGSRPKGLQFVAVNAAVMYGTEHICTAKNNTLARRIARALNHHKPNSKGI